MRLAVVICLIIVIIWWNYKYTTMRNMSRKLWSDHVWLTRTFFLVTNRDPVTRALMKNQEDIGAFLGKYYGPAFGAAATQLLKEHISIVAKIVAAGWSGTADPATINDLTAALYKNGDDIGAAFGGSMSHHMKMHLDLTVQEFREVSAGMDSYATFDKVQLAALSMSDYICRRIALIPWRVLCY